MGKKTDFKYVGASNFTSKHVLRKNQKDFAKNKNFIYFDEIEGYEEIEFKGRTRTQTKAKARRMRKNCSYRLKVLNDWASDDFDF